MKAIRVTREIIHCSKCHQRIRKGELYYPFFSDSMYVHVKCWDVPRIFLSDEEKAMKDKADSFVQAIERNSVLGTKIGRMIKQLNSIRGDDAFDKMEFVSKNFVLEEYKRVKPRC